MRATRKFSKGESVYATKYNRHTTSPDAIRPKPSRRSKHGESRAAGRNRRHYARFEFNPAHWRRQYWATDQEAHSQRQRRYWQERKSWRPAHKSTDAQHRKHEP